ncbi:MAG: histidine phosphatase family protein [Acidimicrobiia bacterium]|jgi:glucosyl-3-phosphoglycerate phosphatase
MLLVVRHGQAAGNRSHRFIGQSDVDLDDEGREQARLVSERLARAGVARIVSSDLRRCLDTVAPLAESTGVAIEPEPRLREVANGEWTGRLPEEIAAGWPELWRRYRSGEDVPRPGGERWADVRSRVTGTLVELAEDEAVIVVATHGGPALLAVEWATGVRLPGNVFRGALGAIANASVTTIDPGAPRLIGFNDVGHLGRTITAAEVPYAAVREPEN